MKYRLLVCYLLLFVSIMGVSKPAVSDAFMTNSIEDLRATLNFDAQQCKNRLPNDLNNIRKYLQPTDSERNIQQYYLMTSMGADYKSFLFNNHELLTSLKNPHLNSDKIIKKLTQRLTDSFTDSLEATKSMVEKETLSHATSFYPRIYAETEMETSEVYTSFPSQKLLSTNQLEKNSQSIIDLLINNKKYNNRLSQLDSASTANFLKKKLGLPPEYYQTLRNDFFDSSTLFNKEDTALRQLATFISYLIIRNQFDKMVNELITREECKNDEKDTCSSLGSPVEALMEKASELLIITMTDWLAAPQNVQACFEAGCDSRFWYVWATLRVKPIQKIHQTYRSGKVTHWFRLALNNQAKTREILGLFKTYMENDACRKYGGL